MKLTECTYLVHLTSITTNLTSFVIGNLMAKHLTVCERKSAYPSEEAAKSATVTHSMLDVLGLVRRPEEPTATNEVMEIDSDDDKSSAVETRETTEKDSEPNIQGFEEVPSGECLINDTDNQESVVNIDNSEKREDETVEDHEDTIERCETIKDVEQQEDITQQNNFDKDKETKGEEVSEKSNNKNDEGLEQMDVDHQSVLQQKAHENKEDAISNEKERISNPNEVDGVPNEEEEILSCSESLHNQNGEHGECSDNTKKDTSESMNVDSSKAIKEILCNDTETKETQDVEQTVK